MEPSTAFSIAKFAYSTYEYLNSKEDTQQFEVITKLLNQINTKLDVLNDKLDLIYFEINQLPNKIEYSRNISVLNGILEDLKPLYNTLNDFIFKFGRKQGIRKFIAINKQIINEHLNTIRLTFQRLENYHDPITTIYISTCVKVDLELSVLIDVDNISIKNRMIDYLTYFSNSTLPTQTQMVRDEIEKWRKYESLLNRGEYYTDLEGIPPIDNQALFFYELKPLTISNEEFTKEQLEVIQMLIEKTLLNQTELNIKRNYLRTNIGSVGGYIQAHLPRPNIVRLINEGYLRPGEAGLISHGFSRMPGDKTFRKVYKNKLATVNVEYLDHFHKLISYLSAINTSNKVRLFLKETIDEYSV